LTNRIVIRLKLCSRQATQKLKSLKLDDKITQYFPDGYLDGLHVLNGMDYTGKITITHLLSNTSVIPDYFSDKQGSGKKAAEDLFGGMDEPWPLEKSLKHVKNMTPKFKPGQKGKAQYSDTNFQLLGRIIETITGKDLADVFRERIFDELELEDTYAYRDVNDDSPAKMYYKSGQLHLPRYIASVTAEGGIVSTAKNDLYFTGTVNQLSGFGHSAAFRAMISIIKSLYSGKL
jgi:D-alanyl-D-alanine carboxypeptidase